MAPANSPPDASASGGVALAGELRGRTKRSPGVVANR